MDRNRNLFSACDLTGNITRMHRVKVDTSIKKTCKIEHTVTSDNILPIVWVRCILPWKAIILSDHGVEFVT